MTLEQLRERFSQSDDDDNDDKVVAKKSAKDNNNSATNSNSSSCNANISRTSSGGNYYHKQAGIQDFVWAPVTHFRNIDDKQKKKNVKNLFCGRIAPLSEGMTETVVGWPAKRGEELVEILGLHENINYMHKYYVIKREKLHPFHDMKVGLESAVEYSNITSSITLEWDANGFENLHDLLTSKEEKRDMVKGAALRIIEDSKQLSSVYLRKAIDRLKSSEADAAAEMAALLANGAKPDASLTESPKKSGQGMHNIVKQIVSDIKNSNLNGKKTSLAAGMTVEYHDNIFGNIITSKVSDILYTGSNFEVTLENGTLLSMNSTVRLIDQPRTTDAAPAAAAGKSKAKTKASKASSSTSSTTSTSSDDAAPLSPNTNTNANTNTNRYQSISEFDLKPNAVMENKKRKAVKGDFEMPTKEEGGGKAQAETAAPPPSKKKK